MSYVVPNCKLSDIECGAEYYDNVYLTKWVGPDRYKPLYQAVLREVARISSEEDVILELGCGPGNLGSMLNAHWAYRGIDFSVEAVNLARLQFPTLTVNVADAYMSLSTEDPYTTIVAVEFMEHVDDRKIVELIRPESKVVMSLPEYGASSHLRIYRGPEYIKDRFNHLLDITSIKPVYILKEKFRIWITTGTRRFPPA